MFLKMPLDDKCHFYTGNSHFTWNHKTEYKVIECVRGYYQEIKKVLCLEIGLR